MLLLWTVSSQDVRGQNIAIKVYFRKSLDEPYHVSCCDAPRLAMVSKHHFQQSYSGNIFKGLASQATGLGLNCSYPLTRPTSRRCTCWNTGLENSDAHATIRAINSQGMPRLLWRFLTETVRSLRVLHFLFKEQKWIKSSLGPETIPTTELCRVAGVEAPGDFDSYVQHMTYS
jgi:hypothetical protein